MKDQTRIRNDLLVPVLQSLILERLIVCPISDIDILLQYSNTLEVAQIAGNCVRDRRGASNALQELFKHQNTQDSCIQTAQNAGQTNTKRIPYKNGVALELENVDGND